MIRTIIVEDEKKGLEALEKLIQQFCPELEIVDSATTVADGLKSILKNDPDLVFLDISMPDGQGYEILQLIKDRRFEVVFTTAHNFYATKAFEFAALYYLLKPIGGEDLLKAVKRFNGRSQTRFSQQHFEVLNNGLQNRYDKLAIPTLDGVTFVKVDEIVRCEAEQSYTVFHFLDTKKIITSKALGKYETLLQDLGFFRVHDKHIINLKHVKKYTRGKGGEILMSDESTIPVSSRKKADFLQNISEFTRKA
jgi:two-component system, LytTR family, response regulator